MVLKSIPFIKIKKLENFHAFSYMIISGCNVFFSVTEGEIFSLFFTGALANTFPYQALFASIPKKSGRKHRAKKKLLVLVFDKSKGQERASSKLLGLTRCNSL